MRVAVVGHVEWVDFVEVPRLPRRGEVMHATHTLTRAAGGGGVAAAVLADLGAEVDFFCALGRDADGQAAAQQLAERGVRVHVAWRAQPTRRALTLLEGGERTIVTIGERLEPVASDDLDWDRLDGTGAVYFTAGDAGALEQARRAAVLVASPRGREALSAEEAGPRSERAHSARVGPHASARLDRPIDALVYSGHDLDEAEWARRLADRARLLVETRGEEGGVWFGEEQGSWRPVAPPGPPRDAYGCGDSFAAGFTFGMAQGGTVAQAAEIGARCGARCLAQVGAP
jgi:ribokinase